MPDITIKQMPAFKRSYKKLHSQTKRKVDATIRMILENPHIGQEKKGDLAKLFVYKFKVHQQQMLLAYEWDPQQRILLALGVHENFYRDLKKS